MKKLVLLLIALSFGVFGCGSGGMSTSGSLTMSTPTSSNGVVTAKATFVPASGPALPNQEIDFYWYTVGVDTKVVTPTTKVTGSTDTTGAATSQYILPTIRTESVIVYVKSATGGLENQGGWQSVVVAP